MNFFDKDIQNIIDKAFRRSKIASYGKDRRQIYKIKINTFYNIINSYLNKVYNSIPDYDKLPKIKRDLIDLYYGNKNLKKLKNKTRNLINILNKIYNKYKDDINNNNIKEFYGRTLSIFKRNKSLFKEIKKFNKIYRKIPNIKNLPTVVISGLPNVGKSTLLKNITGSEPEIKPLPFTTKDLMLGYIKDPIIEIQVIDTPGILDRDFNELNYIEKKALYAIRELSNILVYVIDITDTSGFTLKEQLDLFEKIKKIYNKDIIIYFSKKDLFKEKEYNIFNQLKENINYKYFDDYNTLKDYLIKFLSDKYINKL